MSLECLAVPEIGKCSKTYGNFSKGHTRQLEVIPTGQIWDKFERILRMMDYNTLNKKESMNPWRTKEREALAYRISNNK